MQTIDIMVWNSDTDSSDQTDDDTDKTMGEGAQASRGSTNLPINEKKTWAMLHTMPELHKMQQEEENLDSCLSCLGAAY